jgi:DNA-directed RNA polymerase subunit beta'
MSESPTFRDVIGDDRLSAFDRVRITVADPESIKSWSKGEVKNPETINYRTFKPEKGGLFCEKIFGPTRDWECSCGKYKRIKHKGVFCDRCGVEVTLARVRRERMGHIELAVPVTHIWFYKCMPSRIGLMLDLTGRELERVIYYEDYLVVDPKGTNLSKHQLLTEAEYQTALTEFGYEGFKAGMGAEAIREALERIDLSVMEKELNDSIANTKSKQNRKKFAKQLKLVQGFKNSGTKPEWMVLTQLPVIPPDLRPLVPLEGGRFATSDLNDLYRRVINRNNRLRNLKSLKTPDVIIRNEKRMLQEAVDALFDNGRHGRAVTGAGNRPLKSLSDMLKGKGGRFRQNLLGKRVDYSGRSVIVIGPELKLHQCGLPKKMALVLFEPFIIRILKERGYVHTVRSAKKMIDRQTPEVWDILEEVTKGHPVLLNRAPTLHRLSIQAFEPQLIEGEAIRIHPLVCTAYNADFDGDQMAVHVPLSVEAQMEARMLMLASNNIFSPSSGKPVMTPSQDIIVGCYYLTQAPRKAEMSEGARMPLFSEAHEVEFALSEGSVKIHDRIRFKNPDLGNATTAYGDAASRVIETTAGRVIFNQIWPSAVGFFNKGCGKKQISDIILRTYQLAGHQATVETLDRLKDMGFYWAMKCGVSIGIVDMIIPKEKYTEVKKAYEKVELYSKQYRDGIITDGERYNKVVDSWTQAGEEIANVMFRTLDFNEGRKEINPVWLMVDSGARGNRQQVKQLAGMRGLMAKPDGSIIEQPITSSFREGLTVLEYFISSHGARKGLADTALKTADSGYLTRKLVDCAQDVIVVQEDCGTDAGIIMQAIFEGDEEVVELKNRIVGRVTCQDVEDKTASGAKRYIVRKGDLVDELSAQAIGEWDSDNKGIRIRSVLTCASKRGICAKCYGRNLATGKLVRLGEAVGIIAAQSIGEPGTQLTMRTFHIGGVASQTFKQPILKAKNDGTITFDESQCVASVEGEFIVVTKSSKVSIIDREGKALEEYSMVLGTRIKFASGSNVKKGQAFAEWDPHSVPILTRHPGKVKFVDMVLGVTVRKQVNEATKEPGWVVIEHKGEKHPKIAIINKQGKEEESYSIPAGAHLSVKDGDEVLAGQLLAKTPRKVAKTKDITGGLPRVAELFEARRPKESAEIARISGNVKWGDTTRGKRQVIVTEEDARGVELRREVHLVPLSKHIIVPDGDRVEKGQPLTEGAVPPQDILEILGDEALQEHLVNEVQEVYRLQGVEIADKHIEIIIRQMLRKVRIVEPGDTTMLWGDQVDRLSFEDENERIKKQGGAPAKSEPVLLGITKASLETESFISAASFQDTTRVLTEAATLGRTDHLRGFKENVIMGHLIPAGTGFPGYRNVSVRSNGPAYGDDIEPEDATA